jgi:tetratricopeptide (TPR) repeat protein
MPKDKIAKPLEIQFSEGSNHKITSSVQLFNKKGNKSYLKGNYPKALRLYFKALKLAPEIGLIHYNMALCFLNLNKSAEAAKHFMLAKRHAKGNNKILSSELVIKY